MIVSQANGARKIRNCWRSLLSGRLVVAALIDLFASCKVIWPAKMTVKFYLHCSLSTFPTLYLSRVGWTSATLLYYQLFNEFLTAFAASLLRPSSTLGSWPHLSHFSSVEWFKNQLHAFTFLDQNPILRRRKNNNLKFILSSHSWNRLWNLTKQGQVSVAKEMTQAMQRRGLTANKKEKESKEEVYCKRNEEKKREGKLSMNCDNCCNLLQIHPLLIQRTFKFRK